MGPNLRRRRSHHVLPDRNRLPSSHQIPRPAPVFVAATTSIVNADGTTPTRVSCALPAGWLPGQLAIFVASINDVTGTFSLTAGWDVLPSSPALPITTTTSKHVVATRRLRAGDTAPSFQTTSSVLKVAGLLATYARAALDLEAHLAEVVSQTTHTAPTVTTLGSNRRVLRIYQEKSSQNVAWSGYSGTLRAAAYQGTSGGVSCLLIDTAQALPGATGTVPAIKSVASSQALMTTLVLKGA